MAERGERIAGKYDVLGVLGEGGTGIVYDAVRVDDGVAVALKVMHSHYAGDAHIRGRFRREAVILRRLRGPNVCPILDFGEIDGVVYLALPKIRGRSLEQVMKDAGLLDLDRALDLMLQVCAALRSAHAQGVVHRDLKPANVLLEDGDKVVVVDFGMSKIVTGAGTGTTSLTAHNMLFGTPEYMSPEQARGDEIDARCDVYAAGVMLYELLTGTPPFTASTPLSVLTAHLTSDLEPPSKRAPKDRVSPALESVVLHALARDRDMRYPTAAALSAAIIHARTAPEDVASVGPAAFATRGGGAPGADGDALAQTILVSAPRAVVRAEGGVSPSSATIPSGAPPPLIGPPTSPVSTDRARAWIVLWAIAAVASIGLGVYLALR